MAKGEELAFRSTLDDSDFEAKMRRMEAAGKRVAGRVGDHLKGLATPIAAVGLAIEAAFTGGAIIGGVKNVFDAAESLGDLSDQTGVSVGRLAVLGRAFSNAGLQAEDVGTAVNKMQKFLVGIGETGEEGGALGKLGLNAKTLAGLRPEQQLIAIGKAISGLKTPAERVNAAMGLFGRSGGRLLAAFNDPLFNAAGGPLTGKAALLERNAEKFANISIKLNRASGVLKTFYAGAAERVAGPLDAVLDRIVKVNLVDVGQKFGDALAEGAKALGPALETLGRIDWDGIAKSFGATLSFFITGLPHALNQVQTMLQYDARIIQAIAAFFGGKSEDKDVDKQKEIDAARAQVAKDEEDVEFYRQQSAGFPGESAESRRRDKLRYDNALKKLQQDAAALQALLAAAPGGQETVVIIPRMGHTALDLSSEDIARNEGRAYTGARSVESYMTNGTNGWLASNGLAGTSLISGSLNDGAYGRTGNIWSQISGRVSGPADPASETAKNTADIKKGIDTLVGGLTKGRGGGGGGTTATG